MLNYRLLVFKRYMYRAQQLPSLVHSGQSYAETYHLQRQRATGERQIRPYREMGGTSVTIGANLWGPGLVQGAKGTTLTEVMAGILKVSFPESPFPLHQALFFSSSPSKDAFLPRRPLYIPTSPPPFHPFPPPVLNLPPNELVVCLSLSTTIPLVFPPLPSTNAWKSRKRPSETSPELRYCADSGLIGRLV